MATSGSNLSLWLHKSWTFISEENISWFVFFLLLSELALEVSPRRRGARGGGGGRGGVVRGQRERRVPVPESKNILIKSKKIFRKQPISTLTYKLLSHILYELMNTFYFTLMLDGGWLTSWRPRQSPRPGGELPVARTPRSAWTDSEARNSQHGNTLLASGAF